MVMTVSCPFRLFDEVSMYSTLIPRQANYSVPCYTDFTETPAKPGGAILFTSGDLSDAASWGQDFLLVLADLQLQQTIDLLQILHGAGDIVQQLDLVHKRTSLCFE
jgi:hypothetical protein